MNSFLNYQNSNKFFLFFSYEFILGQFWGVSLVAKFFQHQKIRRYRYLL